MLSPGTDSTSTFLSMSNVSSPRNSFTNGAAGLKANPLVGNRKYQRTSSNVMSSLTINADSNMLTSVSARDRTGVVAPMLPPNASVVQSNSAGSQRKVFCF